jgi:hypothetical protein
MAAARTRFRSHPLILSFSQRTRLGEFTTHHDRIRERMRSGRRNAVVTVATCSLSPRGRGLR